MNNSILPPKSNTIFQLLFGDPRNIPLLADFLKAVFDTTEDEFRDIVIVNPYLPREYPDKKLGIVDLRLTEPLRVFRRLYNLREGRAYGNEEKVFTGSKRAGSAAIARTSGGVRIAVEGDKFDSVKNRLYGGNASKMG